MNSEARHRARGWRVGLLVGGIAGLFAGVLLTGFLVFVLQLDSRERSSPGQADAIIALTGGADRIADAVDLLALGRAQRLLITGVHPSTSAREIGRLTPRFQEFAGCCIDLGYQAVNTAGNAEEAKAWLHAHGYRTAIVVTSSYHMPRALIEMSHAAPGVRFMPHPVVPERLKDRTWLGDARILRLMTVEYLKYLRAVIVSRAYRDIDSGAMATAS